MKIQNKGTTKKILSLCLKSKNDRMNKTLLISKLNEVEHYFDWESYKFMLFRNKNLDSYFATVIVDKDVDRNDMPAELLDTFKIIKVNYKPKENVIFTIDGLNMMLIDKLGVIDKEYEINWNNYKNNLILKHYDSRTNQYKLIMNKIEKLKGE